MLNMTSTAPKFHVGLLTAGATVLWGLAGLHSGFSEVPEKYKHLVEKYKTLCDVDRELCDSYQRLNHRLETVVGTERAPAKKLSTAEVIEFNKSGDSLKDRYLLVLSNQSEYELKNQIPSYALDAIHKIADRPIHELTSKIRTLGLSVVPMNLADLGAAMGLLEKRLLALEQDTSQSFKQNSAPTEHSARLRSLYDDGNNLWMHLMDNTLIVKDAGNPVESRSGGAFKNLTPSGEIITSGLNPLNERLAEFSRRLNALDLSLGTNFGQFYAHPELGTSGQARGAAQSLEKRGLLNNPFGDKVLENATGKDFGNEPHGDPKKGDAALTGSSTKPNLRMRPVPYSPPEPVETQMSAWDQLQATLTGRRVPLEIGDPKMQRHPEDTLKVEKLKARGMTLTYGDPARRAAYTFPQEGGTCAVSSQAQIIAEARGIPPNKMKELENDLYKRASQANCFTHNKYTGMQRSFGGTADQCLSYVLEDSGMLVRKRFGASQEELERTLKRGKMFMITAKAGYLWNEVEEYKGGHAVAVTGSEFHKDGTLLGVYINDTGVKPPHGGRFINAAQFLEAWQAWGSTYVEPL